MSSNFASTKAYRGLTRRTSQSLPESASEASSSARKHSTASRHSSRSSTKDSSKSPSKVSAESSSKPPSKTFCQQSSKSSHKNETNFTLSEINTNGQRQEDPTNTTYAVIGGYATSPTLSNPRYTFSTTTMTEADYQARMQTLLDGIDSQLDLNSAQMDLYDAQLDHYAIQLELDEDESEES